MEAKTRFAFGRNWANYLKGLSPDRIRAAEDSLKTMLGLASLNGLSFLDVGCGSGLFSLVARRLGAKVTSFDVDAQSVACCASLRQRFFPDDDLWVITRGSILDGQFTEGLGTFDLVNCWGVLHHTGAMWQAMERVDRLVSVGGTLYVSIYNDQGRASRWWSSVKHTYNRIPRPLRWVIVVPSFLRLWGPALIRDSVRGRPLATWRRSTRGMSAWHDCLDWVGGFPFEVAKPDQVLDFFRCRWYTLERLHTCGGGRGCNEFVFAKAGSAHPA